MTINSTRYIIERLQYKELLRLLLGQLKSKDIDGFELVTSLVLNKKFCGLALLPLKVYEYKKKVTFIRAK